MNLSGCDLASAPDFGIGPGNVSNFPREIIETALAHVMGDKAEQAYRRSDALEKRRKLMEAWASYAPPVVHGFSSIEMSGWFMSASERADPELYELFKHRLVQCHHACADGGLPAWG